MMIVVYVLIALFIYNVINAILVRKQVIKIIKSSEEQKETDELYDMMVHCKQIENEDERAVFAAFILEIGKHKPQQFIAATKRYQEQH